MLTLTFPHYLGDNLKALLSRLELALSRFFGARKAKAIFGQMGKIGHIKALEVTHGRNGWHPHFHLLIFTKQELPLTMTLRHYLNSGKMLVGWLSCQFQIVNMA